MQCRPALLKTLAAATSGATVIGAFTGYDGDLRVYSGLDERIWFVMLGASVVLTLPLMLGSQVARRIDAGYVAMSTAFIKRQPDPVPTPDPWPALRAVQNGGSHRPPGRHASH